MKRALVILLALSAALSAPASALQLMARNIVTSRNVVIVNRGNIPINFSIRPENGSWGNYSVNSGYNTTISCSGCNVGRFEITINTQGRTVRYLINAGTRYSIEWNQQKSLWDVYKL